MRTNSQHHIRRALRWGALLFVSATFALASAQTTGRIVVSIEPYREVTERLIGDAAEVEVLLPPGASPHAYDPSPRDAARLADADMVVVNGVLDDFTLELVEADRGDTEVVHVLDALGIEAVGHDHDHGDEHAHEDEHGDEHAHEDEHGDEHAHEDEHADEHAHEDEHGDEHAHEDEHGDEHAHEDEHADEHVHDHGDGNPHVFTDPGSMMEITRILADRFAAHWPEEADAIRAAETAYLADLAALDAEIATLLAPVAGQAFVPFHDAWSSFAAHYDLNLVMEIEPFPGREPSARQLAEAVDVLAEYDARAIFSEVQLPDRPARVLADEAGVRLGILDPLGGGEGREGYLATMRYNAQTIRDALSAD